ncbi:hypothetical protein P7L79_12815 [Tistrella mobilis]|uniref:hypothetical protein n=1 Tax=Tistrella mobilis TaxID=171437 RepID=UPI00355780CE
MEGHVKVRLARRVRHDRQAHMPGAEIDLPLDDAERLVHLGAAVIVPAAEPTPTGEGGDGSTVSPSPPPPPPTKKPAKPAEGAG